MKIRAFYGLNPAELPYTKKYDIALVGEHVDTPPKGVASKVHPTTSLAGGNVQLKGHEQHKESSASELTDGFPKRQGFTCDSTICDPRLSVRKPSIWTIQKTLLLRSPNRTDGPVSENHAQVLMTNSEKNSNPGVDSQQFC